MLSGVREAAAVASKFGRQRAREVAYFLARSVSRGSAEEDGGTATVTSNDSSMSTITSSVDHTSVDGQLVGSASSVEFGLPVKRVSLPVLS